MFAKININVFLVVLLSVAIILSFDCVQCNDVSPDSSELELEFEEVLGNSSSANDTQNEGFTAQPTQTSSDTTVTSVAPQTSTLPTPNFIPYVPRPLQCAENQVESNCTNTCEPTCEEKDRERCENRYCWRGCECKPGYVRDRRNWSCILKDDCPKCDTNEHYRHCEYECQPNCANYQNFKPYCKNSDNWRKVRHCVSGCFCDYGYVRDTAQNGTCVPISQCPHKCGPNEYYEESGKPCVRTFADPRPKCLENKPEPTCVCNTGFVRNKDSGLCEPHSSLIEKCGANQTFSYCGSNCAEKCYENSYARKICPTTCLRGCFCSDGYVKDSYSNECVLPDDCVGKHHYY